jgi:hypothetical protein
MWKRVKVSFFFLNVSIKINGPTKIMRLGMVNKLTKEANLLSFLGLFKLRLE